MWCGPQPSGGGGREIITLSPPVLWKYLDIPEKTFSLSHRLFNRKHCEPSELEEPQRCPARLTPQRPLCGIPKVTISQCPILRPLHSCPLNPNWWSCSTLHWTEQKRPHENSLLSCLFNTPTSVPTASVFPVTTNELNLQLYFLLPIPSAFSTCSSPSTYKHAL